ncbi:MAG TPA: DUF1254 domain-containing protein [Bryobacteraceae bacterium]|jgi:hypothetical protein|nr:DUF1254 domain-containing protein [Bryobacteraceae bacterium]
MTHIFRFCTFLALLCTVLLPRPAVAAGSATDPAVITALAAKAYVWGLGPEYIERFSKYNTIIGAPFNAFKYGAVPAAWNNEATNAGNASVLYISGFVKFDEIPELVLTVPPSRNQYYVVAYYDAYANSVGSIGTRTTPSDAMTSYLLVGPKSPYAHKQTAKIRGYEYPVMASDTNVNWFLIRVVTNTLIDASDPTSVPNVADGVVHKFALNTLQEFEANGHEPVYPASFVLPPPTKEQVAEAAPYQNAPTNAVDFFTQLGNAVATSPIPNRGTGLSGTPLIDLPAWVVPQYGAQSIYLVPSYGQKGIFDSFAPLGLSEKGFSIPADWGPAQQAALEAGYVLGQKTLLEFIDQATAGASTNYWGIVNDPVGTYPNNAQGYLFRSLIVVEGGVANIGLDAIYPTLTGNPSPFDGNHTYKLTFTPPTSSPTLPAVGIYPPMVRDTSGNPKGFWSIHVYATDPTQGAAPFIAQTSVLNTSYSTADTAVLSVTAATNSMTVNAPNWGTIVLSTPILFGGDAAAYGLTPNKVYYVASAPTLNADNTYTFQISAQWLQTLSSGKVPIQGPGGNPGPIVHLLSPASAGELTYGMVKPVTQLGSSQLAADQLARNADGSLTLWFGPTLPAGAPSSNWIPTPSTAYYSTLYPDSQVSTAFQLTLRMYYPTPGNDPPSILPCTQACTPALHESYIPPTLELVQ